MANFINFVEKLTKDKNQSLANEFIKELSAGKAADLYAWFQKNKFEVSKDDCKWLVKNRDKLIPIGKPIVMGY